MKKMSCKGFTIVEQKDGTYKCSVVHWYDKTKKYTEICKDFCEAGEFVWNFASNHDISHIVCEKMCSVFGKRFGPALTEW